MFARVITMQLKSDKLDEAVSYYKEKLIPTVKSEKGFNSNYLLVERKTGKAVSVAFWDSEEAIIEDEKSGRQEERIEKFRVFLAGPFTRDVYEVAGQS